MHSIAASIRVEAPVADCYEAWLDFERYPTFMRRVVSVHWVGSQGLFPSGRPAMQDTEDPQKDYEGTLVTELLHEVEMHGSQVWHWQIKGPLGQLYEWTAGLTMNQPHKALSWVSMPEQDLPSTGTVNFMKTSDSTPNKEKTLISVTMSFSPPGGALGELFSDISHYGDNLLNEALEDFKIYMEREFSQT